MLAHVDPVQFGACSFRRLSILIPSPFKALVYGRSHAFWPQLCGFPFILAPCLFSAIIGQRRFDSTHFGINRFAAEFFAAYFSMPVVLPGVQIIFLTLDCLSALISFSST